MARWIIRAPQALTSRGTGPVRLTHNWKSLDDELALWSVTGRRATFWWRDDDASASTAKLETLLNFSKEYRVPVSLSVVPARLDKSLCRRLQSNDRICVLQHGYAHRSHAPAAEKKSEYGAHRPVVAMVDELTHGQSILRQSFADQFCAVLVPPWNRYTPTLLPNLASAGYSGISAMWARAGGLVDGALKGFDTSNRPNKSNSSFARRVCPTRPDRATLLQVNTHSDPVAWRDDRGFIGESDALEQLVCHLRLRREYPQLGDEPTGMLSHHLDQTESVWAFCRQFAERINRDSNCVWLSARDIWA